MAADDVDFAGKPKKSLGAKARSFGQSIWNGDTKEFIGRSGSSWAKIGLFYLVFYSCLAGFFAIMLVGFFSTIDNDVPTQTDMYSLIKLNPGMGFRPMVNIETTLIRFNKDDADSYMPQVDDIEKFFKLNKYYEPMEEGTKAKPFDLSVLGDECTKENLFGYKNGTPCVLLKINRVFNWDPKPFDNDSLAHTDLGKEAKLKLGDRLDQNHVGVTCEGENDADIDNLGPIEYYPNLGFDRSFFPYLNPKNYKSPIVFVRFPHVQPGTVIQVWCKLWVQNIKHHKNDKGGSVHFELLVDQKWKN